MSIKGLFEPVDGPPVELEPIPAGGFRFIEDKKHSQGLMVVGGEYADFSTVVLIEFSSEDRAIDMRDSIKDTHFLEEGPYVIENFELEGHIGRLTISLANR